MSDASLFSWIHLSDIHFGHGGAGYAPNQRLVLEELQGDIAARKRAGAPVDAIFVTGDIAFSGNAVTDDEYARAREWLVATGAAAGVPPSSIFLVPGNHDVDRTVDADPSVGALVDGLRDGTRELDKVLANPAERALLAKRQAAYLELAKKFGPWVGLGVIPPADERLFWTRMVAGRGGLLVRLAGLNTALLAKDRDEKKLALGERQIVETLPPTGPGELGLVLSHHPFRTGWLADETSADQWAQRRAHAHLSGHVHEARTEYAGAGAGSSFVRLVAGAAHGERLPAAWLHASHGYSFGEVHRGGGGKLVLHVHPRLWSEDNKKFVCDVHGVPEGKSYAEHELGVTLAPDTMPAPVSPVGPVRIFVSYAPEDDELRKRLEKHLSLLRRSGHVAIVSGRSVGPGGEWRGVVDQQMKEAHIILLLLSSDYLFSDYCFDVEMAVARERHEARTSRVIPIVLRDIDLSKRDDLKREEQWFEKLQRLPVMPGEEHGKPVTTWPDQDSAWTAVAKAIRTEVERLRANVR